MLLCLHMTGDCVQKEVITEIMDIGTLIYTDNWYNFNKNPMMVWSYTKDEGEKMISEEEKGKEKLK